MGIAGADKVFNLVHGLLLDPRHFWYLAALALVADSVLTQLIIRFVSFTEIDYETYIVHAALYQDGQLNYSLLEGPSGPAVYPAGHIWIHSLLRTVSTKSPLPGVQLAQQIYSVLYLLTVFLTFKIYRKAGGMPNWIILPLVLSKRLHSIFVLRLFNDCWAVLGILASVTAYQENEFIAGTALFSCALATKMNALLYLPGILVVLVQSAGILKTTGHMLLVGLIQVIVAWPFLVAYPREYLQSAFDLSRQFLYKWTVNWRFIPEDVFLSAPFARALLLAHVATLVVFGFRWCQPEGGVVKVLTRAFSKPTQGAALLPLTPDRIATILFTSNLIGIIFARSLHYQFYSWYAQQLPFLAWHTSYPLPIKVIILLGIEYSWNVFPSTNLSSGVLLAANLMLLAGVWYGGLPVREVRSST